MRAIHLVVAVVFLSACGPEFDPAWEVKDLRVLAVQADPPEVLAGETSRISALAVDPGSTGPLLALHLVCAPGPDGGNPCTSFEPLRELPAILRATHAGRCEQGGPDMLGTAIPGGVALAGAEVCDPAGGCEPLVHDGADATPVVRIPAAMSLDGLPAGDPHRVTGRELVVITAVVRGGAELVPAPGCEGVRGLPAAVAGVVESGLRDADWVTAIKRIRLRGPDAGDDRDVNPSPPTVEAPDPAARGGEHELVAAESDPPQRYMDRGPSGEAGPMTEERFTFSWFVTAGELEDLHTRGEAARWTAPSRAASVRMWIVVRDLRGGASWTSREVRVE